MTRLADGTYGDAVDGIQRVGAIVRGGCAATPCRWLDIQTALRCEHLHTYPRLLGNLPHLLPQIFHILLTVSPWAAATLGVSGKYFVPFNAIPDAYYTAPMLRFLSSHRQIIVPPRAARDGVL